MHPEPAVKHTGAEGIRWDLSFIYSGLDDPRIAADLAEYQKKAKAFKETYRGTLAQKLGPALGAYAELSLLSDKMIVYLFLCTSTNMADEKAKAALSQAERELASTAGEYLTFFDLEVTALTDAEIESQLGDMAVKKHKPLIDRIRRFKKHLLTEEVESALAKRVPFSSGAWGDFCEELESDLRFTFEGKVCTMTEMLNILSHAPDASTRATALSVIHEGLGGMYLKTTAQTLSQSALAKAVEDKERGYLHPMHERNLGNDIPDAVVDALHEAVRTEGAPLAQRYYRLKAKLLGLPRLAWSDRNAPLPFEDASSVSFSDAFKKVDAAFSSFSPTLAKFANQVLADKWLDAPGTPGKRGGAYNYAVMMPQGKMASFVFLNYLGSNRDVMTLAHELGHAVHGMLASESQGPLMFRAPMAYAETASVFGEMTTFNHLKGELQKTGDARKTLALVTGKLDDMMNTVVRQIGFSNFERKLHGAGRRLSAEDLNGFWMETLSELYGKEGDVFTYQNTERLWSYVSHFHRPFYCYSYAFGELLTQSLYAVREKFGEKFEPLYIEMLRAGGTKNASELLAPFGLDPANPSFWQNGIMAGLGALVAEAERLAQEV